MTAVWLSPPVLFFGAFTLVLLVSQFLPAKHRNTALTKRMSPLLWVYGIVWLILVVYAIEGAHVQHGLVLFLFTLLGMASLLVKRKMWKDWAVRNYSSTKVVFDDPYEGTDATTPPPPQAPAGWFADTSSRHQLRYWDGTRWTDHVSDNGVSAVDPVA